MEANESTDLIIVCLSDQHRWQEECQVRIGGSDPMYQYRCSICQAKEFRFTRYQGIPRTTNRIVGD